MHAPRVVTTTEDAAALARILAVESPLAIDVESDGIFAYRAQVCTVQVGWGTADVGGIAVVDALTVDLSVLAELLGERGPVKIVHDVAFDARILGEAGVELGNVHDTSIAARMLGRTATGLATLLFAELGVKVEKELQHHDWRRRPLEEAHLFYLASDVAHLAKLHDKLFAEARERSIEPEVLEETRYRIGTAVAAARAGDSRQPFERVKGIERASGVELAVAMRLAVVRERVAAERDVPPHRVLPAEALLAIARSRPATAAQLKRLRVPTGTPESDALADDLLRAVREGLASGEKPSRPVHARPSAEAAKERKAREARLISWRKEEAKRRGVDEQVVLPGHCLKDLAALERAAGVGALGGVPGLGAFRVERDGDAILRALEGPPSTTNA